MANLAIKDGIYLARFRYADKEYKRSLKTSDPGDAAHLLKAVELILSRLGRGEAAVPEGVDPGDFVVSGGRQVRQRPGRRQGLPTLAAAADEYLANLAHLALNTRLTARTHLNHLRRGSPERAEAPIDRISPRDLELHIQDRLRKRQATTVAKERETLVQFFRWTVAQGHLAASPAAELTVVKPTGDRPPFRTVAQIDEMLARGGLSEKEAETLWDGLYLSAEEIGGLLGLVRERQTRDVAFILHAVPAYTGMRRGEVLRLRWTDVEFEADTIVARSLKQSRQRSQTVRRIDLHPELKAVLLEWKAGRPRGQHVVCHTDGAGPLTVKEAGTAFWQPLRRTKWCLRSRKNLFKIGFHTYRHSFASNLAARGVDQRVIDGFMGHTTEAMRKRYHHVFPRSRESAIRSFSLMPGPHAVAGAGRGPTAG